MYRAQLGFKLGSDLLLRAADKTDIKHLTDLSVGFSTPFVLVWLPQPRTPDWVA